MKESTRIWLHERYQAVCHDRGWFEEEEQGRLWSRPEEERADIAREMFGLALTASTDSTFCEAREALQADELQATPSLGEANHVLRALSEEQKSAVLRLLDEVLHMSVYDFTILLDRFDHGNLSVDFQARDEEGEPIPGSECRIHPHGHLEMFQDALRWREEYGLGQQIGRTEQGQ